MDILKLKIEHLKNIELMTLDLPIEKGLYAITGANGTGKSTIMTTLSKLVRKSAFSMFQKHDVCANTKISLEFDGKINNWTIKKSRWICDNIDNIEIVGFYEGSIIHGMRFSDTNYAALQKAEHIDDKYLIDADPFVKEQLSYILHGNKEFYKNLKRINNLKYAQKHFKGIPYFIEGTNGKLNQFCMSTGECMLISLLHMLNNVIIRSTSKTKPISDLRLILIDEIELALHPSAIMRLVDFLKDLTEKYNLCIYFSSHSIELIRRIKPANLFHLQKEIDNVEVVNPCYPSYAARDIYQHSGYDTLILVEDVLAKYILENIIDDNGLYKRILINILPSGGWENVLRMQDDICKSRLVGAGTKVLSILDGDIKKDYENLYKSKGLYNNLIIGFLPISSMEKYLYEKLIKNKDSAFFNDLGDRFFKVKSLKVLIDELQNKNDNKTLYRYLIKCIKEQGLDEDVFVQKVCSMIYRREDFSKTTSFLKNIFKN